MDGSISCNVSFKCAVQSEGRWYRAEVVNNEKHPDVVVSLLDKDLSIMVHAGQIRHLPEELTDLPRTVLRCSLSGIYPASGSAGWSPEVTQHIIGKLKGAEQVTIRYRKNLDDDPAGPISPVSVYVRERGPSIKVNGWSTISLKEELISLGMASALMTSWKPPALPKMDETFWAKATWVNEKGEIFLQDLRSLSELDVIRQYLAEKYKDTLPEDSDLRCSPGDLCIAKRREDSGWYRCIIQQVNEKEVTVFMADYGAVDTVDIQDIRLDLALKEKLVQVLHCSLHNLNHQLDSGDQELKVEQVASMREEVVEREFQVTVKGLEPPLQVMIYPKL